MLATPLFTIQVLAEHSVVHSLNKTPTIEKIIITGLKRTKESVVRRELLFTEEDELTTAALLESIQRLKNLRIFSKALPYLKLKEHNRVELTIEVEEKWTTIPFLNFSGGGDTFYLNTGMYDINTLGHYIETGGQYDNWNGKHGGVVWFRDRRFLNKRILAGADLWSTTRPRTLFTPTAEKQGEYILNQKKLNLIFENEIKKWLTIGFTLQLGQTTIIDTSTTDKIDPYTAKLLNKTDRTDEIGTTFSISLGKLDYDNYLVEGKQSAVYFKYAGKETKSDEKIKRVLWYNTAFWKLPHKANLAARFNFSAIETENIQNFFYIGGFENIRGYFDGQFRNKAFWQTNIEYRIPSYQHNWLVLQHIFFIDSINASNKLDDLRNLNNTIFSAGTGIRIISPKIHSFNGRLDIALLSSQKTQSFISFGAQQFF